MSGVSDVLTLILAVGLALLLHGLVVTGMSTVSYFLLMGPTEGTAPRRVGGIKEKLRDLKVCHNIHIASIMVPAGALH
jgi:hypothetical protein